MVLEDAINLDMPKNHWDTQSTTQFQISDKIQIYKKHQIVFQQLKKCTTTNCKWEHLTPRHNGITLQKTLFTISILNLIQTLKTLTIALRLLQIHLDSEENGEI